MGGYIVDDFKVCELFAGIGGFRCGLEKASPRFRTVYANEVDQYAASIYRYHWPDGTLEEADIKTVTEESLPSFDLLVGGFPCQAYSIAGRRKGTKDPRGVLFYEILRIVKAKRPKMVLLENVPGLLSIQDGMVFFQILWSLANLGYICEWRILDSQYFGVPQQRRRVFIIGYLATLKRGGASFFPIPTGNQAYSGKVSKRQTTCTCIDANYGKGAGGGRTLIIQSTLPKCTGENVLRVSQGFVPTLLSRMGTDGGNVPLDLREGEYIRKLIPVECERLQGFSDDWTRYGLTFHGGRVEVSNTQRYKCLGNAVTVNVVTALGGLILDFLDKEVVQ